MFNEFTPEQKALLAEADRLTLEGIRHHKARRLEEAASLRRQALAVQERVAGPDHPIVAEKLNDLAWVLSRMGRHEEAEAMLERSLAFLDGPHRPAQRRVWQTLEGLAEYAHLQGRTIDADRLFRRLLASRERVLGPAHHGLRNAQEKYTALMEQQDDL